MRLDVLAVSVSGGARDLDGVPEGLLAGSARGPFLGCLLSFGHATWKLLDLVSRDQRVGAATRTRAPRSTDTMDVILRDIGQVDIDYLR